VIKPRAIIMVEWVDSCGRSEWHDATEAHHLAHIRTAGWMLRADRKQLEIALSYDDKTPNVSDVVTIPRICVKKLTKVWP